MIINNSLVTVLVDTGADVNAMSRDEATVIGIPWRKSKIKLRPYGSKPLKVCGEFHGPIMIANTEVETEIFIVNTLLETLISGATAEILGIISFNTTNTVQPDTECNNHSETNNVPETNDPIIKELLKDHSEIFNGIGKCEDKVITLHTKEDAKPCIQPIRPIPFHLREKCNYAAIEKTFKLLKDTGLTLNGPKCIFVSQDIPFWGMRFTHKGIKPCPEKCKALQEMEPPKKKEDVPSFLLMLQESCQIHSTVFKTYLQYTGTAKEEC